VAAVAPGAGPPAGRSPGVAGIGILVNGVTALLFGARPGRGDPQCFRSAFPAPGRRCAGQAPGGRNRRPWRSLRPGLAWARTPAVSLIVLGGGSSTAPGIWCVRRSALALDAVAGKGSTPPRCAAHLAALPGVAAIHDLHIWGHEHDGKTALTCPPGNAGAAHPGDGPALSQVRGAPRSRSVSGSTTRRSRSRLGRQRRNLRP